MPGVYIKCAVLFNRKTVTRSCHGTVPFTPHFDSPWLGPQSKLLSGVEEHPPLVAAGGSYHAALRAAFARLCVGSRYARLPALIKLYY